MCKIFFKVKNIGHYFSSGGVHTCVYKKYMWCCFKNYVYNTLKYNKQYLKFPLDKFVKLNPLMSVFNKSPCILEKTVAFDCRLD